MSSNYEPQQQQSQYDLAISIATATTIPQPIVSGTSKRKREQQQQHRKSKKFMMVEQILEKEEKEMDYIKTKLDNDYLCAICLTYYENPVHTKCKHTFCLE